MSPDRDFVWLQESALDLLQGEPAALPGAVATYRGLVLAAGQTEAEVAPDHDGLPFQTTINSLRALAYLKSADIRRRLAHFVELGLIDPFTASPGDGDTFTIRLAAAPTRTKPGGGL